MFEILGIAFKDRHVKELKLFIKSKKTIRLCSIEKMYPKLAIKLKKIMRQCAGLSLTFLIDRVIQFQSLPLCACGKETITKYKYDDGKNCPCSCNKFYDCEYNCQKIEEKRNNSRKQKYGSLKAYWKKRNSKIKKTCLKKYGVENPFQSEKIKRKIRQVSLKKYGVENPAQSKIIQKRMANTNMKRYGCKAPSQSNKIKEKIKNTNMDRYGKEYYSKTKEFKIKFKKHCLKKYGVENPFQSEKIKRKMRKTWIKNYGVDNVSKSPTILNKMKRHFIKKYGVANPFQSEEVKEKIKETMVERYMVEHPLQNPDIFAKFQRSAYQYKKVRLGDRKVRVQGYEKVALKWIIKEKNISPDKIKVSMEDNVPIIKYKYKEKEKIYYPDFLVGKRLIVEVKSTFTLYHNRSLFNKTKAKAKECLEQGYKFKLLLVQKNKKVIELPKNWIRWKYKDVENHLYSLE